MFKKLLFSASLVIFLVAPALAINEINETFFTSPTDSKGLHHDWNISGRIGFSSEGMNLGTAPGVSDNTGITVDDYDVVGCTGSFESELIWKNIKANTSNSNGVIMLVNVLSIKNMETGEIGRFQGYVRWVNGRSHVSFSFSDGNEDYNLNEIDLSTIFLPEIRYSLKFQIFGPGDWQMDTYYDIDDGKGKQLLASFDDEAFKAWNPVSKWDPTASDAKVKPDYIWMFTTPDIGKTSASVSSYRLLPIKATK